MGENSKIEWTDATWTPIRARNRANGKVGWHCEHASPGCQHCYSESFNEKRLGTGLPFKPGHRSIVEHFLDEAMLLAPLRWRRPRRIFVCSMTDLFGGWVPDAWIDRLFAVMALCPQHTFQVLTKRSARMRAYMIAEGVSLRWMRAGAELPGNQADNRAGVFRAARPLPNVWLGVSAEDQRRADERVPDLLETPAAVRLVSAEPLLGPIDFTPWLVPAAVHRHPGNVPSLHLDALVAAAQRQFAPHIDWIITGGETDQGAHKARPSHPDWFRSIRDQCAANGVPYHHKQNGEWQDGSAFGPAFDRTEHRIIYRDGASGPHTRDFCLQRDREGLHAGQYPTVVSRVGKRAAGRLLDGVEHNGMPAPLARPARDNANGSAAEGAV